MPGRPALNPCGTVAAYKRHLYHHEAPCDECKEAKARHSEGYVPKMRRQPLKPCGTLAAYRRHKRRHEEPCDECTAAMRAYYRGYNKGEMLTVEPGTPEAEAAAEAAKQRKIKARDKARMAGPRPW